MSISYETRYASSPEAVKKYDTAALRNEFLIDNLASIYNVGEKVKLKLC